jgi:hypothetical protein
MMARAKINGIARIDQRKQRQAAETERLVQEARDASSATITSLEQKIANLEDENQ